MTSKPWPCGSTSSAPASRAAIMTSSSVVPSPSDDDDALAGEVVGDAARVGQRAAVAGERGAHLGRGPVLVVGQALDQQGDAAGAVALVHDRGVLDRLAADAGAALDGAVDVVLRDGGLLRLEHGVEERRVAGEVGAAELRGDLDVLDELGPRLRTARVDDGLLVLGRGPLGMPGHISPARVSPRNVPQGIVQSRRSAPRGSALLAPGRPHSLAGPTRFTLRCGRRETCSRQAE